MELLRGGLGVCVLIFAVAGRGLERRVVIFRWRIRGRGRDCGGMGGGMLGLGCVL